MFMQVKNGKKNQKGIIFSLDLVFATILFVFLLGILYQGFAYSLHQYNINKSNIELTSYIDLIENKIALNENFSCELVNEDGNFIKYIAYCIDLTKFNKSKLGLPENIAVSISGITFESDLVVKGAEKKLKIIAHSGPVKKANYYDCVMGLASCDLEEKEIIIGAGYK